MATVLLGLTTTKRSDWQAMIADIDRLGIKGIALFPTTFNDIEQRKKLYCMLEETKLERIPHVHLCDNSQPWELDYLVERFHTEVFNIHCNETAINMLDTVHAPNIYLETTDDINGLFVNSLPRCGGLCLDASHVEDRGFYEYYPTFHQVPVLLKQWKIGCMHVSAVNDEPHEYIHYITGRKVMNWSTHWLNDMHQLDYIKKYIEYLPKYVSIELENPFDTQLKVKAYLEKTFNS